MNLRRLATYGLASLCLGFAACTSTPPGQIGVVRDGGSIDSHKNSVRTINKEDPTKSAGLQCPDTGNRWNGYGSNVRWYPASTAQHTIKFDSEGHPDIGPRQIDSKDNYRLEITGTLILYTNFDCTPKGQESLLAFDKAMSGRPSGQRPWEDWGAWQVNDLSPVLDRATRTLNNYNAAQLVPRAAEIKHAQEVSTNQKTDGSTKVVDMATIQQSVATEFLKQANSTFGRQYFSKAVVVLNKPALAPSVDKSIDDVQAAFGQVAKAQAQLDAAKKQVKVSAKKQESYSKCPSCARQDEITAFNTSLPDHVTSVWYNGSPSR
jgi:hypothetical protein